MDFLGLNLNIWVVRSVGVLLVVLATWGLAKLSQYVLTKWVAMFTKSTKSSLDDKIISAAKRPLYYIILLLGLSLAVDILSLPAQIDKIVNSSEVLALIL